jgi:circadian clock protein KaiB
MKTTTTDTTAEFERLLSSLGHGKYALRLYVAGANPRSTRATAAVKSLCETYLPGRYDLEVIDLYQQPDLAAEDQIVALPTLVKTLPLPLRRLVGDLTDTDRILIALGLPAEDGQ